MTSFLYSNLSRDDVSCPNKKGHHADRRKKQHEKSKYGIELSSLGGEPSAVAFHEVCLPGTADEALNIVQQYYTFMSKRTHCIISEFADDLMRIEKQGYRQIASELVNFLTNTLLVINVLSGSSKFSQTVKRALKKEQLRLRRMMNLLE